MPAPIIWGLVALGGLGLSARAFREGGDAAESAAKLAKWAAVGGTVYVSYRALKSTGVLK